MKLYFSPGACSLSPHIALREAGLAVELAKVDLRARKLEDGSDYTLINPKGYVPALGLDEGDVLTEGPAIVQYIADRNPASGLAPAAGTLARYRLQEWLNFISTEVHKQFSPLFNPASSEDIKSAARDRLSSRFEWIAAQMAGEQYLMGDTFTVADGYLFTVMNWAPRVKVDLSRWPVLSDYAARIAARPAVQDAMRAEGLIK